MTITITTTINPIHIPFPREGAFAGSIGPSGALSCSICWHPVRASLPLHNNLSGAPLESYGTPRRRWLPGKFYGDTNVPARWVVFRAVLCFLWKPGRRRRGVLSLLWVPDSAARATSSRTSPAAGATGRTRIRAPAGVRASTYGTAWLPSAWLRGATRLRPVSRLRPHARGEERRRLSDSFVSPHGARSAVQRGDLERSHLPRRCDHPLDPHRVDPVPVRRRDPVLDLRDVRRVHARGRIQSGAPRDRPPAMVADARGGT